MKDFGLNLRLDGRISEASVVFRLEVGFGEFRGKADFNRCTERLGDREPVAELGVDVDVPREAENLGCISGASVSSGMPGVFCTSLTSLASASLGEGVLRASADPCSRVASGFLRADCRGRGLIFGGIMDVKVFQRFTTSNIPIVPYDWLMARRYLGSEVQRSFPVSV